VAAAAAIVALVWLKYRPEHRHEPRSYPSNIQAGGHVPIEGVDWKRPQGDAKPADILRG
jgi:hypothetical protein